MSNLYSTTQIRAVERAHGGGLMPLAGRAAADYALSLLDGRHRVLVLAGPGNNGGDALEVVANLAEAGLEVRYVHFPGDPPSPESEVARLKAQASSAVRMEWDALSLAQTDLVIDGLFGIGLGRVLGSPYREIISTLNAWHGQILALDVPSGLDPDTGAISGPCVRAGHTITFIGDKPGLHTAEGRDHAGDVTVADLGLTLSASAWHLNSPSLFATFCQARSHSGHKGTYGSVAVMGGAKGMIGAPLLAARAALFAGAGKVFVAGLTPSLLLDPVHPEIMVRDAADFDPGEAVMVVGPGMGDSSAAKHALERALTGAASLVIDADGLNLLARDKALQSKLTARAEHAVLTPHPKEAGRLLGMTAAVVQQDRIAAATEMAARLQAVIVLKGSGTIIALPEGLIVINPTGNPGLATAGSGDVLSGLIGALLAQGWPPSAAAFGGVWLHGAAADRLVAQGIGPIGLTAGELATTIRTCMNDLVHQMPQD